jgi:hypothetical protein
VLSYSIPGAKRQAQYWWLIHWAARFEEALRNSRLPDLQWILKRSLDLGREKLYPSLSGMAVRVVVFLVKIRQVMLALGDLQNNQTCAALGARILCATSGDGGLR